MIAIVAAAENWAIGKDTLHIDRADSLEEIEARTI